MQPHIYTVTFVVISHDFKSCQYVPGLRERACCLCCFSHACRSHLMLSAANMTSQTRHRNVLHKASASVDAKLLAFAMQRRKTTLSFNDLNIQTTELRQITNIFKPRFVKQFVWGPLVLEIKK